MNKPDFAHLAQTLRKITGDETIEPGGLSVESRNLRSPQDLILELKKLGRVRGWCEYTDRVVGMGIPAEVEGGVLLSAELTDGERSWCVRYLDRCWALAEFGDDPDAGGVTLEQIHLTRNETGLLGKALVYKVHWTLRADAVGNETLMPAAMRLADMRQP